MAESKLRYVVSGGDGAVLDFQDQNCIGAIAGENGVSSTAEQGLSYAGAGGTARSTRYGIAIAGPKGHAIGGAGTVVCAYDGGSVSGGDGAIAWARRAGTATTGGFGMAYAQDSTATAGHDGIAFALRRDGQTNALADERGIAIVRTHPAPDAARPPALAVATAEGIAIAFDGNLVQGAKGALLVAAYIQDNTVRYATGIVDNVTLKETEAYQVTADGKFVASSTLRRP